ncbi:MAG: LamG domain-containing protein, partial [Holophagales bacterium]|nr:LamG domain-containing protein [Holophagales bacterium]
MSRAAGTVFSLGARVFRPAAAAGGGKSPPAKPATLFSPVSAAPRLRPAGGSEDPRTQSTAVAVAFLLLIGLTACSPPPDAAPPAVETTALWLFDEPAGLYPSHTLDDMSDNDMVLTLGLGAQVAPGRYGNALLLEPLDPPLDVPPAEEKPGEFGLARLPVPEGRTVEPLSWFTAHFAALMTSGENHLRKQVGHKNPTASALNLGDFDWTVEFWHSPGDAAFGGSRPEGRRTDTLPAADTPTAGEAVVFEIGTGPRGENDIVTQLSWSADRSHFTLVNQPGGASIDIPTADPDATPTWRHYAFTYDATTDQLRHYVDGALQPLSPPTALEALPEGDEAYFTLGTDALWNHRLTGLLDEFRVSRGLVYTADFDPPATFATTPEPVELTKG